MVREVIIFAQKQLRALGLYLGDIDGLLGPKMQAALAAWQAREAVTPAGHNNQPAERVDERSAKNIATLVPRAQEAARQFLYEVNQALAAKGAEARIISGTRTYAEQDALFAKGRSIKGPRVTNARAGYSDHNFGVAWDIGIFVGGKYLEESPLYDLAGAIGRTLGLEWGGDWKSFRDKPHFGLKTGLTLAQMRERRARGEAIA